MMYNDILLVTGLILAIVALTSAIRSYSDGETPRGATVVLLAGGGMVIWALTQNPAGYSVQDIPRAFIRVIATIIG